MAAPNPESAESCLASEDSEVYACPACRSSFRLEASHCPLDGTRLLRVRGQDPLIGSVLGQQYYVQRLVGAGAMGRVYEALDLLGQRVALKVMYGDQLSAHDMRQRFAREAALARHVNHPNVVRVIDEGQALHEPPFVVLEYVNGPTLEQMIRDRGRLGTGTAIRYARGILRGLQHIHRCGIIHRDVKPSNILMQRGRDGRLVPRIADFGIARTQKTGEGAAITQQGALIGSPIYMPPEQAMGDVPTPAADLYAVGATLYHMLSGRPPFTGSASEIICSKVSGYRLEPIAASSGLTHPLAPLISRLMAPNPEDRPQSAGEVLDDIRSFENDSSEPTIDVPGGLTGVYRARDGGRRLWPWKLGALAFSGCLLLTSLGPRPIQALPVASALPVSQAVARMNTAELIPVAAHAPKPWTLGSEARRMIEQHQTVGHKLRVLRTQNRSMMRRFSRLDLGKALLDEEYREAFRRRLNRVKLWIDDQPRTPVQPTTPRSLVSSSVDSARPMKVSIEKGDDSYDESIVL